MKLVYADPPYFGCCALYGHHHQQPYGCWDDLATHKTLIGHLDSDHDGWAYSFSAASLWDIASIMPAGTARPAAWVKPFAAFKRNIRVAYTFELVAFKPGRDRSADGAPVTRDHLAEPITLRRGFTGAKPERFCRWVLDLLGYLDGDEMTDLFPGTGVMDLVRAQGVLEFPAQEPAGRGSGGLA
jgi:hypothetical protein